MDAQLAAIVILTFVIHLVGTLAYAFRIAGVRTGHIAIAFSLFNILVLLSRTSNSFQGPLLAKRIELGLQNPSQFDATLDYSLIIGAASVATLAGGLLIPTFQRLTTIAVEHFQRSRSMPRLILRFLTPRGLSVLAQSAAIPAYQNIDALKLPTNVPIKVIVMNFAVSALWSVGVIASIYAGLLEPDYRVTASSLSATINGVATIMMFLLIDPYLAGLTDDAAKGQVREDFFRKVIIWMIVSRFVGTIAAQFLVWPSAHVIAIVARWI
ncbi:MAG: DUF2837 family protein [Oceanospirillaceae bacterium]|uniref:lipid II flippase Amj family protein n=1 Tax=Salipiger sp. HF18 TaxID=2721557 RepID=UPI00142E4576|nr:lipid II flippase Amj family protein [Salipiger sp. HF18]NIY95868.1 DUF2837 family protein [Salipiger sp. HF18]NVK44617.1 DUF2837 family protein [Oceanospirillaceae bacterium]